MKQVKKFYYNDIEFYFVHEKSKKLSKIKLACWNVTLESSQLH